MKIERLRIRDFRNLRKIDYEPYPGLNIFMGDNAQGKTSLLEAIFVLATGSSFRSASDANLVNQGSHGYMVQGEYTAGERRIESQVQYQVNDSKSFFINKKKCSHNHGDRLKVVLFTPDDLFLVKGAPGKRRAFLDFILKQLSAEYFYNLENYQEILKKRNAYLKKETLTGKTARIINDIFVEQAIKLILQRINFVNLIDELCGPIYKIINGGQNQFKARYALSFAIESDRINTDVLREAMQFHIQEHGPEEIKRRKTMVGPHLEDINFYQDGNLARIYASQGQQRNMAISLKLTEIYAYARIKEDYPVFLLDEVLAELDEGKRRMLLAYLQDAEFQSFLTAVKMDELDLKLNPIWHMQGGSLERKEK